MGCERLLAYIIPVSAALPHDYFPVLVMYFFVFCFKHNSGNSYPICMLEGSFKSHEEGLRYEYTEPAIILHFTISS